MELKACTIAGCRPTRFKWKYKEHNEGCQRLKDQIREQLVHLCEQGVRRFYLGGSLGVDLWAGELLLELKEQYNDIELILVLPYPKHDKDWDKRDRYRLSVLRQHSAEVVITGTGESAPVESFKKRDQYMLSHSDCLLAVHDCAPKDHSGIAQIVNYSRKKKLPVTLIHPDTTAVTCENPAQ